MTWTYYNKGKAEDLLVEATTLNDLPVEKSKTGVAFCQTEEGDKYFDIPDTKDIWIKFDTYWDGHTIWRVGNKTLPDGDWRFGMHAADKFYTKKLYFCFVNDLASSSALTEEYSLVKSNTLQTILLHMVSGESDSTSYNKDKLGLMEVWVDGEQIYYDTCENISDFNLREPFKYVYLDSEGEGALISNITISNAEIFEQVDFETIQLCILHNGEIISKNVCSQTLE